MTSERLIAGRYAVEAVLGFGGMGIVYAATDTVLDRPVAVKTLHPTTLGSKSAWRRFRREAFVLSSLQTPLVPALYGAHLSEPTEAAIVTERLHGRTLDQHLAGEGRLAVGEAAHHVSVACRALAVVHALGLVHRDVKPANLFQARDVDRRRVVKLIDFGIACQAFGAASREPSVAPLRDRLEQAFGAGPRITRIDESIGSPCYQAPEQMMDPGRVDGRADVWSLGVVLFELVTGACPFDSGNVEQTCWNVLEGPLPRLGMRRPEVPPAFCRIVEACLERRPEQRMPSVQALERALQPFCWSRCEARLAAISSPPFAPASLQGRADAESPGWLPGRSLPGGA